jgi:hypothetical protein
MCEESSDEAKANSVKKTYQLLRNWCFTYNFLTLNKDDARNVIPSDFAGELKEVLTTSYSKFEAAIKATKEEYEKELPAEVQKEVVDRLIKFVSARTADNIDAKFDSKIAEWTTQIDAKKDEVPKGEPRRPRRNSKGSNSDNEKRRRPKKNKAGKEENLEEQLRNVMSQVADRSSSVRFSKDDFESLSEA